MLSLCFHFNNIISAKVRRLYIYLSIYIVCLYCICFSELLNRWTYASGFTHPYNELLRAPGRSAWAGLSNTKRFFQIWSTVFDILRPSEQMFQLILTLYRFGTPVYKILGIKLFLYIFSEASVCDGNEIKTFLCHETFSCFLISLIISSVCPKSCWSRVIAISLVWLGSN